METSPFDKLDSKVLTEEERIRKDIETLQGQIMYLHKNGLSEQSTLYQNKIAALEKLQQDLKNLAQ